MWIYPIVVDIARGGRECSVGVRPPGSMRAHRSKNIFFIYSQCGIRIELVACRRKGRRNARSEVLGPCDDDSPSPRLQLEIREDRQIRLTRVFLASRATCHAETSGHSPHRTAEKIPCCKVRALYCFTTDLLSIIVTCEKKRVPWVWVLETVLT